MKHECLEGLVKLVAEEGGRIPPLDETIPLSKIKPTGDAWYFSIECPKCRRTSPTFRDYSDGKLGNPFTGRGAVVAACHFWAHQIRAAPDVIASVLWRNADCGNVSD